MALPSSGPISLSNVSVELGNGATVNVSLNDSAVRGLFGKASGAIAMSDGYGKANQFVLTISSSQSNVNLRTLAVSAGWNQSAPLVATIDSGVTISSASTGTAALVISGSFPGGVSLTNNGTIIGRGGDGGAGGDASIGRYSGLGGASGGTALQVSSAITITNNNRISGGGGGGGGGAPDYSNVKPVGFTYYAGGGGGGGIGGSAGGSGATAGGAGTTTAFGGGGAGGGSGFYGGARAGGSGGSYGSAGSSGGSNSLGGGGGGGAAGAAVSGNSFITWAATGTRNGGIS